MNLLLKTGWPFQIRKLLPCAHFIPFAKGIPSYMSTKFMYGPWDAKRLFFFLYLPVSTLVITFISCYIVCRIQIYSVTVNRVLIFGFCLISQPWKTVFYVFLIYCNLLSILQFQYNRITLFTTILTIFTYHKVFFLLRLTCFYIDGHTINFRNLPFNFTDSLHTIFSLVLSNH